MNPSEKVAGKMNHILEVGFEQPVSTIEKMQFSLRKISQIGTRRAFRHIVIVGTPYDECRWLVFAQVFAMVRKPGPVLL